MIARLLGRRGSALAIRALQPQIHTSAWLGSTLERPSHHGATVVLVSGGLESTALLSYWTHWSHASELIPLYVNYGQRNAGKEEDAARAVCLHLELPPPEVLNVGMLAEQFRGMQRGEEYHSRASFRNLLLLSLAASTAAETGAVHVALAVSKDHGEKSSDSSISFLRHAEALLHVLDPPIALLAPLAQLTNEQVVQLGDQVDAPWDLTWSCLNSGSKHCGKCPACLARKEALGRL